MSTVLPQPWLAPVGSLLSGAAAVRAALYRRGVLRQARLRGPVISVGNLRVGGSGKTPIVARLARLLMEAGQPVSILSRGYGGASTSPCLVVSDGVTVLASARDAGDEPVMLARKLPGAVVAVGRRRDVVGRAVEDQFGVRAHLLDDGFQHLRLARDLDVACVTPRDLDDRVMPAGWLREGRGALARADVVLVTRDGAPERAIAQIGADRAFFVSRRVQGFFDPGGAARPVPARAFLLSGIARPERFAADIAAGGSEITGHEVFPDHHTFTSDELARTARRAAERGADALVTTEKDLVRIATAPLGPPLLVLRIDVEIEDDARFRARVLDAILGRRR